MTVIRVVEHKTELATSAEIVLPPGDLSKLHTYMYATVVRPSQDKGQTCPYLLCMSGGKQVENLTTRFRTLAKKFALSYLTAMKVRKIAATEAALNLEGPDAILVTRQLSHTADTDINYYQS